MKHVLKVTKIFQLHPYSTNKGHPKVIYFKFIITFSFLLWQLMSGKFALKSTFYNYYMGWTT